MGLRDTHLGREDIMTAFQPEPEPVRWDRPQTPEIPGHCPVCKVSYEGECRLHAAAPALLVALQRALRYADALPDGPHDMSCEATPGHCTCWVDTAHAALAAAEGKMP